MVAQQRAHQSLFEGFERDDVLAAGQYDPSDGDRVHVADGLVDHGGGVVPDLAVRTQIIGADDVARVDLVALHEFVDLDGAGGFQRDVLELFLRDLDVGVGVDLEALHDVFAGHLLAGLGIDAGVLDAVTRIAVDLVEADLFGIGSGRIERDGTGNERKAQEAFPDGARGHGRGTPILMPDSRRTADLSSDSASFQQDHFFGAYLRALDLLFLLYSNHRMTDRPASWLMPTPKQMEKLAGYMKRCLIPLRSAWASICNRPRFV